MEKKEELTKSNNIKHIEFILDKSGSMFSIWDTTIDSTIKFIEEQKKTDNENTFSLVTFSSDINEILTDIKLKDFNKKSLLDIEPGGMTALNDAIGYSIIKLRKKKQWKRENKRFDEKSFFGYVENTTERFLDVLRNPLVWKISIQKQFIDIQKSGS